jgi:probable phosphoglycerate mutase
VKLILLRHGAVEGMDPPRFRGRKDIPLTETGRAQAETTGRYIRDNWKVNALITSPLARCVETGAAIAAATGLAPTTSELLLDFDYGDWVWKTHPEVRSNWPELYDLWFSMPQLVRIPGGETLQDLFLRSAEALREIFTRNPDYTVVVVAHDTVNRSLLVQLLDLPMSAYWRIYQDPCCINLIEIGDRTEVRSTNCTAHLRVI